LFTVEDICSHFKADKKDPEGKETINMKKVKGSWMVAHARNLSYSGGRDQEDHG
jgi:hypothetical protein